MKAGARFLSRSLSLLLFLTLFLSHSGEAKFLTCSELVGQSSGPIYDYIVIGAGPGGAPVAARLALAGYRVLVLEAGGPEQPLESKVPALHAVASELEPIANGYTVTHYSDAERARRDSKYDGERGGIFYPRGEGLGGSALVNATITVLPHRGDFDRIGQQLGDPYWSDETMWRIWQKIEDCRYRPVLRALHRVGTFCHIPYLQNGGGHGFDGWLTTTRPRLSLIKDILLSDSQLRKIVFTAERENRSRVGGILHYLRRLLSGFDPNDRRAVDRNEEGLILTPLAVNTKGERSGVRQLLLTTEAKMPDHLHIATNVYADRAIFDGKRATHVEVEFRHSGERARIAVTREVIVSAGSYETPAFLMRSGIGPRAELEKFGLPVVVDNPHVGHNLHDRYEVGVISQLASPVQILQGATFSASESDPLFQEWSRSGAGLYGTNGSLIAFTARSHPSLPQPDLYIFGLPAAFKGYERGYSRNISQDPRAFTWAVLVGKTKNRSGVVLLSSTSPKDQPQVNFKYFDEGNGSEEDQRATLAGVQLVRALNAKMPIGLITGELTPGVAIDTDEALRQWIRAEAWGHHVTGSAGLGLVTDSRFRNLGTENLRNVDASIFRDIPGTFIASSVYIISEMAAERILEDAGGSR